MKKIYLLFSIGCFSLAASAQITITAANNFAAGDTVKLRPCVVDSILETASGANVTANFSALVASGSSATNSLYVAASGTAYAASFPAANLAAYAQGSMSSGYQYLKTTANTLEMMGLATSAYAMVYSDPQVIASFPITFNASATDNFAGSYTANGITTYRTGTSTTTADAYGTITTPNGTFQYLRLKIQQSTKDSFNFMGNPGITTTSITTYNYMSTKRKGPVFSLSYTISGLGTSKSGYYDESADLVVPTGAEELPNMSMVSAFVYPNPAASEDLSIGFSLNATEDVNVVIMDLGGRMVYSKTFAQISAGDNKLNIGSRDLKQGVYFVNLSTGSGMSQSMKVMIR